MESGKDVSEGGAKYNSYGGTATGLATTADSLPAIKYMAFDHHLVDQETYLKAILADWKGYEDLQQRILHEVPHYGNADPYADSEMKYVIDLYYNISRAFSNKRCKVYKCGTFGAPATTWSRARSPGRPRTGAGPASRSPTPPARRRAATCRGRRASSSPRRASTTPASWTAWR